MANTPLADIWRDYKPFPSQRRFHQSQAPWRLLAGGFGGGKTKPAVREAVLTAVSYPKSLGIIARKQYRPLIDSTWRTFRRELAEMGLDDKRFVTITGGNSPSTPPYVKFSDKLGGSEILFRNAESEENLYGVEPDWVFFDEGSEIADNLYEVMGGRLRGTRNSKGKVVNSDGYRVSGPLRAWIATNPGPSGFIRRNFCPPGVAGTPTPGFEVFPVPTLENPTLPDSYIEFLKTQYTGARFDAFVSGDWSAFEGQVFTQFDPNVHMVDDIEPKDLEGKLIVEGVDFGRAVETAVVWAAVAELGHSPIVVFHDYGAAELEVSEHAKNIKRIRSHYGIREVISMCDPAGRQRGASGSYIEEYARAGIYLSPCDKGKLQGVRDARLGNYLSARIFFGEPAITFCRRVEAGLIRSLLLAQYRDHSDPNKDRPDERKKKEDHRLDALEYALFACPPPRHAEIRPAPPGVNVSAKQALAEWEAG